MKSVVVEGIPRPLRQFDPWLEDDFVGQILRCASTAFPGFMCAMWKPLVRDRSGRAARPDVVMVAPDLSNWYVVEVELSWHTYGHISEQLDILGDGIFDHSLTESLATALPAFGESGARALLKIRPGFLCIVNAFTEAIQAICRASPFDLVVAEPYRSQGGEYALVITQSPALLRVPASIAGVFVLRRGQSIGDSEFAALPPGFPSWAGPVDLLLPDKTTVRTQVVGSYLLLRTGLSLPHKSLGVRIVDASKQILKLEELQ